MARATFAQSSFLGGEWSSTAQGRFDLPEYRTAMNVCLNGIPIEPGAWTRRPGTSLGGHTRNGSPGRVIAFSFQNNTPYTMEFTDGYLRFYAGNALVTGTAIAVAAISGANPAVVQTTGAHGLTSGQQIVFKNLSVIDPYLLNRQFIATVVDATHISIAGALSGNVDGSLLQAFGTGKIAPIVELQTIYANSLWQSLQSIQSDTQAILLSGTFAPQVLIATVAPSGSTPATFTLQQAQLVDGPYLDPIVGMLVTPASTTGSVGITFSFQTWSSAKVYSHGDYVTYSGLTYKSLVDLNTNQTPNVATAAWLAVGATDPIDNGAGLQTTDIGRHVRILSEPLDWASGTTYAVSAQVKYGGTYWTSLVNANTANQPGSDATKWAANPANARWSWGKITSLSGSASSVISRTLGSTIGNMTGGAGIAAAFDGVTAQGQNSSAQAATNQAWVGKNFTSSPQKVVYALYWTANDNGFSNGFAWNNYVILTLRASQSAPSGPNDGTILGKSPILGNIIGGSIQVNSNDQTTLWNYVWWEVQSVFSDGSLAGSMNVTCAEAQFFNTVATPGTGMTIQLLGPDLLYTSAASIWRLGAYSDAAGWPTCGTLIEGRLWLSGAISNRFDASALVDIQSNPVSDLFHFTPTLQDGTVSEACAINYTLNGPDVNPVFWMQPDAQGVILGTQAGEWLAQATSQNPVLTPLNIKARRVTKIGAANILPRQTEHTIVFAQRHQRKIVEYFADVFSGKFTAPDLMRDAKHLANRKIMELAYQQEPVPVIWARCADGSLIGGTYRRNTLMTSQGPTFMGWHPHTLGSGRTVESITVGPSPANARDAAGDLDALAMVTYDGSTRWVEFATSIFDDTRVATDAWFVDSGVIGSVTQNVTSAGVLGMQVAGLWALNGKTCAVICGGFDCGDFVVTNGKCFVPYTNSTTGIFTAAFAAAAPQTIVGFTYNSDGQLVRNMSPQDSGARLGPALGKKRRVHSAAWLFIQSQGVKYGTTFANNAVGNTQLKTATFTTPGGTPYAANALYSGVWFDTLMGNDDYDGMICWRISRPYPCTIAAIEGWIDTKDA